MLMLILTTFEAVVILFVARESTIPGLPAAAETSKAQGGGARLEPVRLNAADLTPETLREYVVRSEPVVIEGVDPEVFKSLSKYAPEVPPGYPTDKLLIDAYVLPLLGTPLFAWIKAHIGPPILYLARFSGGYKGGFAHIDSFPSYNYYYVRRGRKKVNIVPRQYNPLIKFGAGYDSMFVLEDAADESKLEWMDKIPALYEFEVSEGDVLLFNNSACIHKFMNLSENPEIFTLRLFTTDASPLTLKNDLFNWTGAKYFTSILMDGGTHARDTGSV